MATPEGIYDPCSCGSGNKYKFCCYQKDRERRKLGNVESLPTVTANVGAIIQLKVTLLGSDPEIWRRLLVYSSTNLESLHDILQVAMPWDGDHMHQFAINDDHYGHRGEYMGDPRFKDESSMPLHFLVTKGIDKFTYEYDFGDGWNHDIIIEGHMEADSKLNYPVCVDGAMACPPDDCGGIYGFYAKLEWLKDPKNEYHNEYKEWFGDFSPEKFSAKKVSNQLQSRTE